MSKLIRTRAIFLTSRAGLWACLPLCLAFAGPALSEATPAPAPIGEQVDALFSEWDSTATPGCALSVSQDGELLYAWGDDLYAVSLSQEPERAAVEGIRHELTLPAGGWDYDVAPDGRIVVVVSVQETRPELRLITNWTSQLNELAPHSR